MMTNNLTDIKNLLKSIGDPAMILNDDYSVNSVNQKLEETFKQNISDITNPSFDEIFTGSNIRVEIIQALKKVEVSGNERLSISTYIDNKPVDFIVAIYGNEQERDRKYIVIFIDVTQQIKRERKQILNNHLQEKEKHTFSLGILSEGIAHEINNPNNIIMMNASILQKIFEDLLPRLSSTDLIDLNLGGFDADTICEKMRIMVEGIQYGAKRIKKVTSELRDYSAKNPEKFSKIDINKIITSSLRSLQNTINDKVNKLNLNLSEKEPLFIKGIDYKIEEAIVNLILNGCESFADGEKELTINSHIDYKTSKIVILITDSGSGIDRATLEHIKDPFFTTRRENGAIGLGLSIANRTIEEHNGNLVIISEPKSGTTAIIQLPLWEDHKI